MKRIEMNGEQWMEFQQGHSVPIEEIQRFCKDVMNTYGKNMTFDEFNQVSYKVLNDSYDDSWYTIIVCANKWLYKKYMKIINQT